MFSEHYFITYKPIISVRRTLRPQNLKTFQGTIVNVTEQLESVLFQNLKLIFFYFG